jgi:uncharacterized membrane protein YdjX (TVP38/TMEM64 family)
MRIEGGVEKTLSGGVKPADRKRLFFNLYVLGGLAAAFILAYFLWPAFGWGVRHVTVTLLHGDLDGLKSYLLSFGVWSPVIAGLIMVFQGVVAPLPAFIPALANGLLFGAFWGTLLTWSTSMIGAILCFYIARSLGRPAIERLVSRRAMSSVDRFFERYGNNSVLIARFLPVVSFSAISYVAGVTSISFVGYFWATAIGILPGTIVFCVLGQNMTDMTRFIWYGVSGIAALFVLGFTVKQAFTRRLRAAGANPEKLPVESVGKPSTADVSNKQ